MSRSLLIVSWLCLMSCLFVAQCPAEIITLASGEKLVGKVIEKSDQQIVLQHAVLGTLKIPSNQVASIEAGDAIVSKKTPTQNAVDQAVAPEPAVKELQPAFIDGWKAQLEIGGAGTSGNTETLNLRAAFNAKKETDLDRWKFDSAYYYASDHHQTTKNELTAGLLKDWLIPDSPWFYFAQGRYDFNQFQSWRHRISGAGGVGYQLLKTDTLSVLTRAGLGGAKEFGDSNELRPEAQLGGEITWKINGAQSLNATTYYYPDLLDVEQYRIRSTLDWTLKLSSFDGLSLKLGLENEYQSFTSDDSLHNDFKAYGAIVVDF